MYGVDDFAKSLEKFKSRGVVCDDELRDEDSASEGAYFVISVGSFRCEEFRVSEVQGEAVVEPLTDDVPCGFGVFGNFILVVSNVEFKVEGYDVVNRACLVETNNP